MALGRQHGWKLVILVVVVTGFSLIVLRYLGWTFVVCDGPGVGPLETWNLDSQGHWECLLLWNSLGGPWYIQLVSVYDLVVLASDVGVNLAHGW